MAALGGGGPVGVFFSYAREDARASKQLHNHLAGAEAGNLVHRWSDRDITPGAWWRGAVVQQLQQAQIVLALISSNFLASRECILEYQTAGMRESVGQDVEVLPVIISPVSLIGTGIKERNLLPPNGEPPTSSHWTTEDDAWKAVADAVAQRATAIKAQRAQVIPELTSIPARDPSFWDRNNVLDDIRIGLQDPKRPQSRVLGGRAGVGKRSVAREYAWRHMPDYSLIWWFDCDHRLSMNRQITSLATELRINARGSARLMSGIRERLADPAHGSWLLIFANAASPDVFRGLVPAKVPSHGHVLVSSDARPWPSTVEWGALPGFEQKDAVSFLIAHGRDPDVTAMQDIATVTNGLPAALAVAAEFTNAGGTYANHLELLRARIVAGRLP
jgi:hypothetical protein